MVNWPDDPTNYKQLLEFLMHELRSIHGNLDSSAAQIAIAVRGNKVDVPRVQKFAPLLVEELLVLHNWLSIADFYLDPVQFGREEKRVFNLFDLFYKAISNLGRRAKNRNINIELVGVGVFPVRVHRILSIVPYILLDNALKYSPSHSHVTVTITEAYDRHQVRVTSLGPHVRPDEIALLVLPGFRGTNAQKVSASGAGQGLALLNAICAYHSATLDISSDSQGRQLNGIDYSEFSVTMKFHKA